MRTACSAVLMLAYCVSWAIAQDDANDRRHASFKKELDEANHAISAHPLDPRSWQRRARLYAAAGQCEQAIADFDRLIELDSTSADAFDARGSEHFKLGRIRKSIEDFDRAIRLRPDREPWHWKRGISYYYAGRYEDGRRQFEGYQTVDDNDVENAVWRYLCMARDKGVDTARDGILKIKPDPRVGMMAVYALYSGRAEPPDVLAAARAGSPTPEQLNARLFYAHLYLGLYWESLGDAARAKEHMAQAVEHKIGHYMWNVADVHARRLQAADRR